jgi:hypothetical protein
MLCGDPSPVHSGHSVLLIVIFKHGRSPPILPALISVFLSKPQSWLATRFMKTRLTLSGVMCKLSPGISLNMKLTHCSVSEEKGVATVNNSISAKYAECTTETPHAVLT